MCIENTWKCAYIKTGLIGIYHHARYIVDDRKQSPCNMFLKVIFLERYIYRICCSMDRTAAITSAITAVVVVIVIIAVMMYRRKSDSFTSYPLPWGVSNFETVVANGWPTMFIENGIGRRFMTPTIYQSWGSPPIKTISTSTIQMIPIGLNMPFFAIPANGTVIRSNATGTALYKMIDGRRCLYADNATYVNDGSPRPITIDFAIMRKIPVGPNVVAGIRAYRY